VDTITPYAFSCEFPSTILIGGAKRDTIQIFPTVFPTQLPHPTQRLVNPMMLDNGLRSHSEDKSMVDAVVEALILDLLEWVASGERSYEQVLDAWRTSCPKLPVWEDAVDRRLVVMEEVNGRSIVRITPSGLTLLEGRKRLR
jgi:D-3-phosphoglycerate dehydrogenase